MLFQTYYIINFLVKKVRGT